MLRAVAILALVVTMTTSRPPSPTPTETHQRTEQGAHDGGAKPAGKSNSTNPFAGSRAVGDKTSGPDGKGKANDDAASSQWWFNLLLVIFTGALAALAFVQSRTMSGQLAEMKTTSADTHDLAEAAKNQVTLLGKHVDAAAKAADAAASAADTAKRALEMTERPDVLVTSVSLDQDTVNNTADQFGDVPLIGTGTVLTVIVTNYGRTTARELSLVGKVGVGPPDDTATSAQIRVVEVPRALGAGAPYEFSFRPLGNFFDQPTLDQVFEGAAQLSVEVEIYYDDEFNDRSYFIKANAYYREKTGKFLIYHTAVAAQPKRIKHAAAVPK